MATQAPANAALPLLYNALEPLNSTQHGQMRLRPAATVPGVSKVHAFPITIEEFVHAQRNYPIIFSAGDESIPMILMGMNEGINSFLDDEGVPIDQDAYMPAYLRRYPFMLAKLRSDSDELSLCFDRTSGFVVEGDEGEPLFDGNQPTELTKNILAFCEQFEVAGQRTNAFVEELKKLDLLMQGEVSIQPDGADQPFVYRGFRMVDEEKLRNMRGDELRKLNQSGALALIFAHLMSLGMMREVFYRQVKQNKGPIAAPQPVEGGKGKKSAKTDAEA